jgi:hypothetical protein
MGPRGVHSFLYFAYTCVRDLFIGGGYLPCKKNYKAPDGIVHVKSLKILYVMVFLHVKMFHYFEILYFTCTFFTKFTYNEYIGPYVLSHVVLRFSLVNSSRMGL